MPGLSDYFKEEQTNNQVVIKSMISINQSNQSNQLNERRNIFESLICYFDGGCTLMTKVLIGCDDDSDCC